MGLPPVNLDELLRYYGGPVHHAELTRLKALAAMAREVAVDVGWIHEDPQAAIAWQKRYIEITKEVDRG